HDRRLGTHSQPRVLPEFVFQLTGRPTGIAQRHQDVVGVGAIALAQSLQDVLGGRQSYLSVHRQGGLPATNRPVQDEPSIDLYRTAEVNRQASEGTVLEWDLDLLEQGTQRHVRGAIDHHSQRTLIVMLANIGQGLGKVGIGHVRHGDQEVIGEIYALHGLAFAILPALALPPQTRLGAPRYNRVSKVSRHDPPMWPVEPASTGFARDRRFSQEARETFSGYPTRTGRLPRGRRATGLQASPVCSARPPCRAGYRPGRDAEAHRQVRRKTCCRTALAVPAYPAEHHTRLLPAPESAVAMDHAVFLVWPQGCHRGL